MQVKFSWFQARSVFYMCFHLIFLKSVCCFFHLDDFVEINKDAKHLVQALNIVDETEQINQNLILFPCIMIA